MPKKKNRRVLKTGSERLDNDLRELFEICESERLDNIKKAIANKNLSSEAFGKVVPESLIRLSSMLVGAQYTILLDRVNKDSIPVIKQAKSLIEKHFGNLFENKNAKSLLEKGLEQEEGESLHDKDITSVAHYRIWAGSPPKLVPAVFIGFKNKKGKIVWDSRLDWEELSFLLEALAEVLFGLLDKGKPLAEYEQIDLSDAKEVGKRIRKTLEVFEKIKQLAPTYKINLEGKSKKEK